MTWYRKGNHASINTAMFIRTGGMQNYYNKTPGLVELKPQVNITPTQPNPQLRFEKKGR